MHMDISDDLPLLQVEMTVYTTSTFLCYFFSLVLVNVHLGFELIFFHDGKLSYLTAL